MYLLIVFLPLLGSSVVSFFGRFLGAEGTAIITTGRNLVLFAILIFGVVVLFRLFHLRLNRKSRFLIYVSLFFVISVFAYSLRIYLKYK